MCCYTNIMNLTSPIIFNMIYLCLIIRKQHLSNRRYQLSLILKFRICCITI